MGPLKTTTKTATKTKTPSHCKAPADDTGDEIADVLGTQPKEGYEPKKPTRAAVAALRKLESSAGIETSVTLGGDDAVFFLEETTDVHVVRSGKAQKPVEKKAQAVGRLHTTVTRAGADHRA